MTANQIAFYRAKEEARANAARERETERSNRASEAIKKADIRLSANHALRQDVEANRSNTAREIETGRANRATEAETRRHDVASEAINAMSAHSQSVAAQARADQVALNRAALPTQMAYQQAQTTKTNKESDVVYMNAFNSRGNIFGLYPSNKSRAIGAIDWSKADQYLKKNSKLGGSSK